MPYPVLPQELEFLAPYWWIYCMHCDLNQIKMYPHLPWDRYLISRNRSLTPELYRFVDAHVPPEEWPLPGWRVKDNPEFLRKVLREVTDRTRPLGYAWPNLIPDDRYLCENVEHVPLAWITDAIQRKLPINRASMTKRICDRRDITMKMYRSCKFTGWTSSSYYHLVMIEDEEDREYFIKSASHQDLSRSSVLTPSLMVEIDQRWWAWPQRFHHPAWSWWNISMSVDFTRLLDEEIFAVRHWRPLAVSRNPTVSLRVLHLIDPGLWNPGKGSGSLSGRKRWCWSWLTRKMPISEILENPNLPWVTRRILDRDPNEALAYYRRYSDRFFSSRSTCKSPASSVNRLQQRCKIYWLWTISNVAVLDLGSLVRNPKITISDLLELWHRSQVKTRIPKIPIRWDIDENQMVTILTVA